MPGGMHGTGQATTQLVCERKAGLSQPLRLRPEEVAVLSPLWGATTNTDSPPCSTAEAGVPGRGRHHRDGEGAARTQAQRRPPGPGAAPVILLEAAALCKLSEAALERPSLPVLSTRWLSASGFGNQCNRDPLAEQLQGAEAAREAGAEQTFVGVFPGNSKCR